jgi:hypothetical protein
MLDWSTRDEHIRRIAWLVVNFEDKNPIEIQLGVNDDRLTIKNGKHRLAAAA